MYNDTTINCNFFVVTKFAEVDFLKLKLFINRNIYCKCMGAISNVRKYYHTKISTMKLNANYGTYM